MEKRSGLFTRIPSRNVTFVNLIGQEDGSYIYPGVRIVAIPGKGFGFICDFGDVGNLYFYSHHRLNERQIRRISESTGGHHIDLEYVFNVLKREDNSIAYDAHPKYERMFPGVLVGGRVNEATSGTPELYNMQFAIVELKKLKASPSGKTFLASLPLGLRHDLGDFVCFVELMETIVASDNSDLSNPVRHAGKPTPGPVECLIYYQRNQQVGQKYVAKPWLPGACVPGWGNHIYRAQEGQAYEEELELWRVDQELALDSGEVVTKSYGVDWSPMELLSRACVISTSAEPDRVPEVFTLTYGDLPPIEVACYPDEVNMEVPEPLPDTDYSECCLPVYTGPLLSPSRDAVAPPKEEANIAAGPSMLTGDGYPSGALETSPDSDAEDVVFLRRRPPVPVPLSPAAQQRVNDRMARARASRKSELRNAARHALHKRMARARASLPWASKDDADKIH